MHQTDASPLQQIKRETEQTRAGLTAPVEPDSLKDDGVRIAGSAAGSRASHFRSA
jgi:hypothetical protein